MSQTRALGLAAALALAVALPVRAAVETPGPGLDRSTPRRSLRAFLRAARRGDDAAAARCLSLYQIAEAERATAGPRLARELQLVLDHELWIEWEKLPDKPEGEEKGKPYVLGTIASRGEHLPVVLVRAQEPTGEDVWLFSEATVERIPALWEAHGAGWIGDWLPPVFLRKRFLDAEAWQWAGLALALAVAYVAGLLASSALVRAFAWGYRRRHPSADPSPVTASTRRPLRWALTAAAAGWLVRGIALPSPIQTKVDEAWSVVFVLAVGWLAVRFVDSGASVIQTRLMDGVTDESRRRGVKTQVAVLRRVASSSAILLAVALVLTRFQTVRHVGMSLLASAGIAGIVVGIAAQRSLGALLAGLQLSITQPIRIDDTIVVGGQWGWVEEIHLTYVVVKLRDRRRLVVPVQKLLEEPFQNWTRTSPEVTGTLELTVTRDLPIAALREELQRLCRESPLWDGRTARLQVTALAPDSTTVEATVSAADAGKSWDLVCELREKLLGFIQRHEAERKAA